ncbi:MAG: hypothetical protein H0V73_06405 [Chloroflexi bacterium]|nr:hypothetical protein [Chloroflexota bacterium]
MAQRRLLYLDEDMPKRLATELRFRGRNATSIHSDGRAGTLDPDLVTSLVQRFGSEVVLVTANESMPVEHADVLRETAITVAVIDGAHSDVHQDAWKRETVHRWAHVMEEQEPGTVRRYSPKTQGIWRRRRRQPQLRLN